MTLDALLTTLHSRGIVLSLDGEQLRFRAPAGALTPELREAIASHRADIQHHLREKSPGADTDVSAAEKRLWFASRLAPEETPYNVSAAFRLTGRLDVLALEAAFGDVISAHDALRTGFHDAGGEPMRFVNAASPFQLRQFDHSDIAAGAREPFARDLAARLSRQPIALDQPPLLRPTLVRFADHDHLLIHLIHHIVTDGWSHALFCRDLAAAYRARRSGAAWIPDAQPTTATSPAPAPPTTAVALPDAGPAPLPHDTIRAGERPHDGHTLAVRLPARMHDLARDLARRRRTSVATVLLAVQLLLVARLSSTTRPMVAVPVASRRDPALADRIGFHVDTLIIATDCGASTGFNDLLREVHRSFAGALDRDHSQDFSVLLADRALTSFAYQATPDTPLALDQLDVAAIGFERGTTRFDLELHVWPLADHATSALLEPSPDSELQLFESSGDERPGLRLMLTARSDSFSRAGAARWLRQYVQLLASCLATPDANLADLALVSSKEASAQQQTLERPRALPLDGCGIAARFVGMATAHRDAIAMEGDDGRTLSYAELEAASRALGERLVGAGVMPSGIVGVAAERSAAAIIMLLAVIRAGGAYLPLDPALPDARLALMLDQAGVRHVVTSASLGDRLSSLDASRRLIVVDAGTAEAIGDGASATLPDPAQIAADSPAYVNFTSGSTGTPKAILVPQGAVANLVIDTDYAALSPADRIAQAAPLSFDAATFEIWGALLNGGCVVLLSRSTLLDPDALATELQRRAVSVMFLTTALFNQVAQLRPDAFAPLRLVLFGGEAVNAGKVRSVLAASAPSRLLHVYGPTETTTFATFHSVDDLAETAATVPIGRPLPGVICRILDAQLREVPAGVPGELCIGGNGLARGYLGDPAATEARFVIAPDGARLYRSGDLVRLDPADHIEFVGRRDNQVKIRGHRIEIEEIELALASHAAVAEAAVIVHGQEQNQTLQAFVTLHDTTADIAGIARWLRQRLPDYMIPARITAIARLPVSDHGKIDRAALRTLAASVPALPQSNEPANDLEAIIISIWSRLLARPIGRDSDFFENGGHSLLATRVVSQLAQASGFTTPLRLVFENRTPRLLAAAIVTLGASSETPPNDTIAGTAASGAAPLSFAQQRLWFLERLDPGTAGYNVPIAYRLDGPLDQDSLRSALDGIVARHEPLRSRIVDRDGQSLQEPLAPMICPLQTIDLDGRSDCLEHARGLIRAAALEPFDLAHPPLIRAVLIRIGPDRAVLLLVLHHIACDGWSLTVLARELSRLLAGENLPPLPLRYADFTVWQRDWFAGARARDQLKIWSDRLVDLPALRLPLDYRRPARQSYRGGTVAVTIDPAATARLKTLAKRCNATPFMVLLAIYGAVMGRAAAQDDFALASPIANRHRQETEDLVGFFVNTLAIRLDLSGAPSLHALVTRLRSVALEAYQNQDLPFEQLVEQLRPDRDPARNPFVQVAFVLQTATDDRLTIPGVVAEPFPVDIRTTRFDIETHLFERDGRIEGLLVYASDLFAPATAARLARQFETLLSAALVEPNTPLDDLALLSSEEARAQQQTLERPRALPLDGCGIAARFVGMATAHRDAIAMEGDDGRTLSYAELEAASRALGERLVGAGVMPSGIVGVAAERSAAAIIMLLAVIRAGGAYLPLDPALPDARLALMLDQAGVRHVVTSASLGDRLSSLDASRRLIVVDAGTAEAIGDGASATLPDPAQIAADSPAYVNFTSGSTGTPKAILVPQGAVANLVIDTDYAALSPADRIAQAAPLSFDAATFEIWGALLNGGCVVLLSRSTLLDPDALATELQRRAVSVMFLTTALFNQVAQLRPDAFAPLRLVLFGGEAVNAGKVRSVLAASAPSRLLHVYGPTETTTFATFHSVDDLAETAATVPIGRPLPGVICRILDAQLREVPAGVPGELCIGGNGLARGYLGDPAATEARFVIAPDGARLYRSGDLVRLDPADHIEFVGRRDNQVKIRGHRIEIEEVELALASHPAVAEAAVIVHGQEQDQILQAFVTLNPQVAGEQHDVHGQAFIADWHELYETTYGAPAETTLDADLAGWNDSYTGRPIAVDEMREWQSMTTNALLALRPRRVLEIGCGTGLMLRGLAPIVERYHGTDFSPAAVVHADALARKQAWDHVTIEQREADRFDDELQGTFDLIVLNSIVQYFPSRDYLLRVLQGALRCLAPGGRIYIGDVRSLSLQRLFAISIEARHHALNPAALLARAANRVRFDKELVLDPSFFLRFAADLGQGAVRIALKRGTATNELTKYRYEVVIDTGHNGRQPPARCVAWAALDPRLAPIEAIIVEARAAAGSICITDVPESRLADDLQVLASIDPDTAPAIGTAPNPESLATAAASAGFDVDFAMSAHASDGVFDLLLYPSGSARPISPLEASVTDRPWAELSNNPLQTALGRSIAPELKAHLGRLLPDYMVPLQIAVLDRMPLARTGKLDRRALPLIASMPDREPPAAPADDVEHAVHNIWRDLLQRDHIGRTTNFFDAGGHSLLLVRLLHRINGHFGRNLALVDLFRATTIAAQATLAGREATTTPEATDIDARADRRRLAFADVRRSLR